MTRKNIFQNSVFFVSCVYFPLFILKQVYGWHFSHSNKYYFTLNAATEIQNFHMHRYLCYKNVPQVKYVYLKKSKVHIWAVFPLMIVVRFPHKSQNVLSHHCPIPSALISFFNVFHILMKFFTMLLAKIWEIVFGWSLVTLKWSGF